MGGPRIEPSPVLVDSSGLLYPKLDDADHSLAPETLAKPDP